jgi:hypothetical protein
VKRSAITAIAMLVPLHVHAQVPTTVGENPINLDPSKPGSQAPAAPTPPPPAPPRPAVVIVGPDGKMISGDSPPATPGGYYISGGGDTPNQPDVIHSGVVPELHVVRSGDTLWDICSFYFADPWQWPKIWSYNPQITNPHWIYPGDLVRLLPRGLFVSQNPTPGPDTNPKDPVPAPQRRIESQVTSTAFVEKSDLDKSITIEGSVEEKVLLGVNDEVYLTYPEGKPPQVGKRYSIYVPGRSVKSGGKDVGTYVHLLGALEVVSVKQDKRARGRITEANQEIERGAKVGPLVTKFKNVPPSAPKVDLQGSIVAMLTKDQLIGDKGEVVFIALGKRTGIEVGNRMYVVRRGDAYPGTMSGNVGADDRRFPARALGEIVVIEVGENISIGVVTLTVQEMSIGDIVMMQKAK